MRPLSSEELLAIWERGHAASPHDRVAALLAQSAPDESRELLSALTVAERDRRLLRLREWTFGRRLTALVDCPDCGGRLELELTVDDVRTDASSMDALAPLSVSADGYDVTFRLPSIADLADLEHAPDLDTATRQLFARCLLAASRDSHDVGADDIPPSVIEAVGEAMARVDPQADVQLALACPGCGRQWESTFDVASFFWREIHAWALRLLHDVHRLASTYGWREADILSMSPMRRQIYLDMQAARR